MSHDPYNPYYHGTPEPTGVTGSTGAVGVTGYPAPALGSGTVAEVPPPNYPDIAGPHEGIPDFVDIFHSSDAVRVYRDPFEEGDVPTEDAEPTTETGYPDPADCPEGSHWDRWGKDYFVCVPDADVQPSVAFPSEVHSFPDLPATGFTAQAAGLYLISFLLLALLLRTLSRWLR